MKRHIEGSCWVIPKNGELIVYDNTGKEIGCKVSVRVVTDVVNEFPTAILEVIVNIAASEEEMMKAIEDFK
jgi:hypothetical protein